MANETELIEETEKRPEIKTPEAQSRSAGVKVRLLGDHTHEGISYSSGDIITVDESSAKFIVDNDAGVRI